MFCFVFCKQKTAYEVRISDWSSDVCSSDLAYLIGREFVDGRPSCLVLGDNIFHGPGLTALLKRADEREQGATVFGYWVRDPERYGVAEFDADGKVVGLEEKPAEPRSNYAVTGLYFYDGRASDFAAALKPSPRGELEITDLNRCYLEEGGLHLEQLGRSEEHTSELQ